MTRQQLKELAKAQLGMQLFGRPWLLAVAVTLIYGAVLAAAGNIPVAGILISGPISYGFAWVFLRQSRDGAPMEIGELFCGFSEDFVQTMLIGLLTSLFTALWTILFFPIGIVKGYAYSMAYFVKADNPHLNANDCITLSREIMDGHKIELFVLDLSFIGWYILGYLCLGVGVLWVIPYHNAARAQFYNAVSEGREIFD